MAKPDDIKLEQLEKRYEDFKNAIARIYHKNGKVIGAGFLVSQYHLLTCAHVVTAALGIITNIQESPDGIIELDFPLIAPGQKLKAKVVFWQPVNQGQSKEDIAGLQIEETLPMGVSPIKLVTTSDYWQHKFRIFGFPQGHDTGVWADGELRDVQANRWIQIEAIKVPGYQIERGFSGSPIWDETLQGVVGMAVAAEKKREGVKAAFMIPTTVLVEAWSFLNLINILTTNSDSAITSAIQTAYQTGCSQNPAEKIPTTIEAIVQDLYDLDKINLDRKVKFNPNGHTAKFLQFLINDNNVPHDISEKLKTWGQQYIENFDSTYAHIKDELNPNITPESYILIKIEPLQTKSRAKKPKFKISGWVIPNIQNYIIDSPYYHTIDISDSHDQSFKIEDIPKILKSLLTKKINFSLEKHINIVFFLPKEHLIHPVEQWEIDDFGETSHIGEKYRVIVRDVERLDKQYLRIKKQQWIDKWDKLQNIQNIKCNNFQKIHEYDANNFSAFVNQAIGIILNIFDDHIKNDADKISKIFGSLQSNVIPLAICHRNKISLTDYQNRENHDLNCCSIDELLENVRINRLESRIRSDNHLLGNDVILIYENPHILTPESSYFNT
ncbi:trypsin-like peptidase domain-containing protein [Sphaerospermopsis torques-reginae]|uniref:Serine protease n=1 Tax=Sphaerospermopsis torques-reginae ITEP-024 TaxID=984208 RepID=A0ABX8WZU7_9CYAN|nr:trypsin-like peptidase domain-containing protein [Sphaerospermopsis torques-reginae]QYX31982.1 serine protease [Sphaerospermopsis torques-reginae ITEP-024]